ncbi:MAG: tetratricopeptide repeat protein, partial [Anaerolineales bacterium]|nr:tetratricopeptide repeat protein [Anaerolineales bacterium]
MAKVSLRIYNREIEGLVDQGHTDEAIAHCRHILKTFPKHLETYRLLGKAYLEARRYGEAVDIFSRVLASVPEDFVSHVGMSIINDEQNQLDNAIWHMERAFEAQPSNAAIQGELQRLYGRRDGMEPPKVRMTRGALAHMYVQGELYPQAIAEIKAVLAQDAQRTDLQVLLAKAYFKSGQKMEAKELCAQLLKKSLYCFDANRIMLEFLHANPSAAENTQVYRMRVGELDPYANASKESVFQSNEVPDAAINLEKLEYTGQEVPIGQEWSSSLGIHAGDSGLATSAVEPDWLRGADAASTPQADIFAAVQPIETQAAQPADDIPDFLRAAGWGASTGPEQPTSFFDAEDATASAPSSNEDLVSASIPDWLKGQMPTESAPPVADESAEPTADVDWLNSLTTAAQQNSQASHGEMPDWLSGGDSQTTSAPESAPEQPLTKNADVPDWLAGLEDSPAESAPLASAPDWLAGLDDSKPAQNASTENKLDVPDWLSGLDDQPATTNESQPVTSQTPANIESLGASAQEQDDAVAWLESLAAKHGAKPE